MVINSYCMQNFGLEDYRSTIINTVFSVAVLALIISLKRVAYYGLVKVTDAKKYLYFIPLLLIVSVNLWNGLNVNHTPGKNYFLHVIHGEYRIFGRNYFPGFPV